MTLEVKVVDHLTGAGVSRKNNRDSFGYFCQCIDYP